MNGSGLEVLQAFLTQPRPWLALLLALSAAFLMGFARSGLGTGGFVVSGGDLNIVHRRMEVLVALLSLLYVALVAGRNVIASAGGGGGPAGPTGLVLVGSGVGISQTVANSGSPLLTVFFLRHQVPRSRFVAAQLIALMVQNLLKLIPLISLGILHLGNAGSALLLIPVTVIGNLSGQRFYRGASERLFFLCYQVLLLIGFAVSVALIAGRSRILGLL
ncbi:hypothetical protein CWE16_11040 [Synechococcus sp. BS55D]|nr:hypothetical protein CWE16_11040 [Synechococcus sp. BS55D]